MRELAGHNKIIQPAFILKFIFKVNQASTFCALKYLLMYYQISTILTLARLCCHFCILRSNCSILSGQAIKFKYLDSSSLMPGSKKIVVFLYCSQLLSQSSSYFHRHLLNHRIVHHGNGLVGSPCSFLSLLPIYTNSICPH